MATVRTGLEGEGEKDACKIVVLYQDVASRNRAIEVLDHLLVEFREEVIFETSWWGFKFLQHAQIAQEAAAAAAAADVILVAIPSGQEIPAEVKAWFDQWVRSQAPAGAALGLLELPTLRGERPSMAGYFHRLAQQAGLDYLAWTQAQPEITSPLGSAGQESKTGPGRRMQSGTNHYLA